MKKAADAAATMSSSDEASSPPPPPSLGARWRCGYCTYDNWARASRCTMCKAARVIRVIAEAAPEEDIGCGSVEDGGGCGPVTAAAAAEKNNNSRNASSTDIYSLSSSGAASSTTSAWNYDQVGLQIFTWLVETICHNFPHALQMIFDHAHQIIVYCLLSVYLYEVFVTAPAVQILHA